MNVTVTATVGTSRFRNTEIGGLEVVHTLGDHGTLRLDIVQDRDTDLSLSDLLGQPVEVVLSDEGGEELAFAGTITRGSQSHLINYGSRISLEGATSSQALQDHRGHRYFRNATLEDVAGSMGARVDAKGGSGEPLNYVQVGESDFDFLLRVADDHGCYVATDGQQVLVRKGFSEPVVPLVWGRDLLEAEASARPVNPGFKGSHFQASEKKEHRFHGVRRGPKWMSGALAITDRVEELSTVVSGGGDPQVTDQARRVPTLSGYKKLLERESERTVGTSVEVHCSSVNVRVKCGGLVDLQSSGAFDLPLAGQLGVTKITHRYDGQQYSNRFEATPWANFTPGRPVHRRPRSIPGVRFATVVDCADPALEGRVRLRYRWQEADEMTGWVPVSPGYGGNGRGIVFLPEVDDQVLVAFEEGDPERPIVLGGSWNGQDKPPVEDAEAGGHPVKKIVTRSGNTIRFADQDGLESVEVFTAAGRCAITLTNDHEGRPLITLHSEGDLALEAEGEIRLSCESLVQRVGTDSYRSVGGNDHQDVVGDLVVRAGQVKMEADSGEAVMKASGAAYVESVGSVAYVTGPQVLMNPMGYSSPEVTTEDPGETASTWVAQEVPEAAPLRSSGDAQTPRVAVGGYPTVPNPVSVE